MNNNEKTVEEMIVEKELTAPRVTPEHLQSVIKNVEFLKATPVLTICVLTLRNGFTVTGESACASPENYNEEVGHRVSKENAVNKIWVLEGYLLKQKIYEESL